MSSDSRKQSPNTPRWHWGVAFGLFALAQCTYTLTLYPTVSYGDSGTLIAVAHTMGIAHQPGYPLYTLIAHLFSIIPIETIAWRVNLASAVFGAAGVGLLFMTMIRLTRSVWASVLAAGLYAFSPLIWHHSLLAEVFSLANLFAIIIAYVALGYRRTREDRILYLLAFVTGLGLAHHQSLVFWAGPVWIWLFWERRKTLLVDRQLRTCALFVLLGLTPYLYLRVNALRDPQVIWGEISSWTEFLRHVRRFQYGTFNLVPVTSGDSADAMRSIWFYVRHVPSQMLFVGVPAALWGVWAGIRQKKVGGFVAITGVSFFLYVVVFHFLAKLPVTDQGLLAAHLKKFWMLPNLFLFMWAGIGLQAVFASLRVPERIGWILVPVLVLGQMIVHYKAEDQSDNTFFQEHATLLIEKLPPGSILLTEGDTNTHTLQYLNVCERVRGDVSVVSLDMLRQYWAGPVVRRQFENVTFPGEVLWISKTPMKGRGDLDVHGKSVGSYDVYSLSYLFDANIGQRPIYTTKFLRQDRYRDARSWSAGYELVPMGALNRVFRRGEAPTFDDYFDESFAYLPELARLIEDAPAVGSWEYFTWAKYWRDYRIQIAALAQSAIKDRPAEPSIKKLVTLMEQFNEASPEPLEDPFYWDLAFLYTLLQDSGVQIGDTLTNLWRTKLERSQPPSVLHRDRITRALRR